MLLCLSEEPGDPIFRAGGYDLGKTKLNVRIYIYTQHDYDGLVLGVQSFVLFTESYS